MVYSLLASTVCDAKSRVFGLDNFFKEKLFMTHVKHDKEDFIQVRTAIRFCNKGAKSG